MKRHSCGHCEVGSKIRVTVDCNGFFSVIYSLGWSVAVMSDLTVFTLQ